MAHFGEKIKSIRKERDMSQESLARLLHTSKQVVSHYELGHRTPKIDMAARYAAALNVPVEYLVNNSLPVFSSKDIEGLIASNTDFTRQLHTPLKSASDIPHNAIPYTPSQHTAPILGRIPAGYPVFAASEIEGYAPVDYSDAENYFWLRVSGDSMINADIHNGDLVLIRRQGFADDGQIVAARVNGDEATLKRFRRAGDTVMLVPENPKYSPIPVPASAFTTGDASIIGIAVELKRKFV